MILLGGINGTGKTSVCRALSKLYGLKCTEVEPVCYEGQNMLAFEVYAYGITMFKAHGDVLDESPLTHYLYVRAIPSFSSLQEVEPEEYSQVASGMLLAAKKIKEEGNKLVWLTADPAAIQKRLRKETGCRYRPFVEQTHFLLGTLRFLEKEALQKWKEEGVVDLVVDTTEKSPEQVAEEVMRSLGEG